MLPKFSSTLCLSLDGVSVEELPLPNLNDGYIRIQTIYSCISSGTESTSVSNLNNPLFARAISKPEQLNQVISSVRDRGIRKTFAQVNQKRAAYTPLGYSCVGRVVEVNSSSDYNVDDIVACGGVSFATHGTYNTVPESLCALVPSNCDLRTASTVALGAISLHAFRRTESVLGSNLLIYGLGPLGILAAEIASSSGCNVVGFDISSQRVELSSRILPNCEFYDISDQSFAPIKSKYNSFFDAAIVSASSSSTELLDECCFFLSRKAKLVILGDVPIQCNRSSIYKKEIDLRISSSYGPGRYDNDFEELNIKYPLEYVRWTESENFKAYLNLIAHKKINSVSMSCSEISQSDYKSVLSGQQENLFLLIKYLDSIRESDLTGTSCVDTSYSLQSNGCNQITVDFIGLSGYLKSMIMPNISSFSLKKYFLFRHCYSSSPSNASSFGKYYNTYAYSNLEEFFNSAFSNSPKLVIIASAHSDHCYQVKRSLDCGYIVYCEKPLCLNQSELDSIKSKLLVSNHGSSFLLVGYNRRFSPHTQRAKKFLLNRPDEFISNTTINYTVNIKNIINHPWLLNKNQGSRNIGETCHMYDFCNSFFDNVPLSVQCINLQASSPSNSFVVVLRYPEGNTALINYAITPDVKLPKEHILFQSETRHVEIIDFRKTRFTSINSTKTFQTRHVDKGQSNMWRIYSKAIISSAPPPIPFQQIYSASAISFEVEKSIS